MYPWEHKLKVENFIQLPQYLYCKLFGISKKLYHNFEIYIWPKMKRDIHEYVEMC
jgi:hypothetical protein